MRVLQLVRVQFIKSVKFCVVNGMFLFGMVTLLLFAGLIVYNACSEYGIDPYVY